MSKVCDELLSRGGLLSSVTSKYDFRLTPYLEELLKGRPADDPLVVQFLPDRRELDNRSYETADPIGDEEFSPVKGIVHRYPDRALLKVLHSCPVYCRFCFRREMVGAGGEFLKPAELDAAVDYVRAHPEIWELILTGGEPLAMSNRRLRELLARLSQIDHLSILRIHSRMPTVDPERIDEGCVQALRHTNPVYFVAHVNHPEELTGSTIRALRMLADGGLVLLSQSVLLRGVNDDAKTLEALFRALVKLKVRPYYLHHGDLAPGTSHFRVSIETGQDLMRSLRGRVSGLCLPTYVLDIPHGFGKVPIGPSYVGPQGPNGEREILDYKGRSHKHPE